MRLFVFTLGVFAAIICIEKPAEAQSYPWCAYYNSDGGATNCGFATFEQCRATISGIGGLCGPNPQYQGSPATRRPSRHSY